MFSRIQEERRIHAFRAEDYVKADSLPEAYKLCQKHNSLIVGGMVWLKTTSVTKRTIADLFGPRLDKVQETKEEFRAGAMCTLRQLETDQGLNQYSGGIFKECIHHIMGVQMCNLVTVGGSIYSRLGFSDILTCLMALDIYVELHHGGVMPLEEFSKRPVRRDDRDILVRIIIKKSEKKAAYTTQRNSETDFPVIACCVSRWGNDWYMVTGARPGGTQVVKVRNDGYDSLTQLAGEAADSFTYSSNTRVSGPYRRQPIAVYIRRLMEKFTGRSVSKG